MTEGQTNDFLRDIVELKKRQKTGILSDRKRKVTEDANEDKEGGGGDDDLSGDGASSGVDHDKDLKRMKTNFEELCEEDKILVFFKKLLNEWNQELDEMTDTEKRTAKGKSMVWSLVRRFDQPQKYKPFVCKCIVKGDFKIGSVREVNVRSGLPATTSTEMLEVLDDEEHILGIRIVGGDHRLKNYSSILTVQQEMIDGRQGTVVTETFVVDVPEGNTQEETCYFVKALINCNLKSLADVSERMAMQDTFDPISRT